MIIESLLMVEFHFSLLRSKANPKLPQIPSKLGPLGALKVGFKGQLRRSDRQLQHTRTHCDSMMARLTFAHYEYFLRQISGSVAFTTMNSHSVFELSAGELIWWQQRPVGCKQWLIE